MLPEIDAKVRKVKLISGNDKWNPLFNQALTVVCLKAVSHENSSLLLVFVDPGKVPRHLCSRELLSVLRRNNDESAIQQNDLGEAVTTPDGVGYPIRILPLGKGRVDPKSLLEIFLNGLLYAGIHVVNVFAAQ